MRARLTACFVVVSVLLLVGTLWIHGYSEQSRLRTQQSRALDARAGTIALLIEQRHALGEPVDSAYLSAVVDKTGRIAYDPGDGSQPVVAEGTSGAGLAHADRLKASAKVGAGSVTVTWPAPSRPSLLSADEGSGGLLILFGAVFAGFVGYLMSLLISRPFRRLAGAAEQLGRGRFDIDLPRTRVPEARAVSQALLTAAGQLQERLTAEQAFAEHASHVLRTPMTGLRLEMEELAQRDDVPIEVRSSATRSVQRIAAIDRVASELVELTRRSDLMAAAGVPLRDLATQGAQTWADALAEQDRSLTAAVEGDLAAIFTPGPVEHILDLLLADVLRRGVGPVRLVLEAHEEGHLSIEVTSAGIEGPERAVDIAMARARAVVGTLGGRFTVKPPDRVVVLLPRR